MRGKKTVQISILLLILIFIAQPADTLDYPHTSINNIGCNSCHFVYGSGSSLLLDGLSYGQNIDDTQYNALCWSCHNDIQAPYMRTHSSLQIDNSYGDWTVECRTCHYPHSQKQLRTHGSASYLTSGVSTGITTTTLTETGAGWTTDAYQGLVLIPKVIGSNKKYGYKITGNTNETITVEGPINLTKAGVGDTFAVIYGKLINSKVVLDEIIGLSKSGDKTVKFFNTTGTNSFADGNVTYDGLCEVCHTQTTHFKSDGTGSDQLHANMGSPAGTNCTNCHQHLNGFQGMGGGAHETHVTSSIGPQLACTECHGANVPPVLADGQNLANTTVCNNCHSTSGSVTAKIFWNNDPGTWVATNDEESFCGGCHDATPGNSKKDGSGNIAYNVLGDNSTYGFFVTGHGKASGTYGRLSWQATSASGNSAANKACSACHDLTTAHFSSGNKRLIAGYENDANNSNCKQCHSPGNVATGDPQWYTTYTDYQNSAHSTKKCSECHDVHGVAGAYKAMTKKNQETLCYDCHTDGVVQNNAISGSSMSNDIEHAFTLPNKHNLGTSFSIGASNYTLECISCHNVHIITGKYWEANLGKSPVTLFSNNTAVWGDDVNEKMEFYAADAANPGIYEKPGDQ